MIDVKNLSKSFGDNLVLNDISEHIYPGDKVVIIGPSGSGKSTFLRCLNLMEYPTSGTITFDGTETTDPKVDIDEVKNAGVGRSQRPITMPTSIPINIGLSKGLSRPSRVILPSSCGISNDGTPQM